MAKNGAGARRPFGWRKHALLCGAAACLAALPVAQAAAETLAEALALAYEGNPNLKAARAQLRATDENVAIAISGWRPSLTINGSLLRQRSDSTLPNVTVSGGTAAAFGLGTVYRTNEQMTATITEPVFRGFKTVAGTSQAKNQVFAQRARLEQAEAQVLLQVATAYFDVLQNEAVLNLEQNNTQVLQRNLEATNDRFRVGEITRTDVAQSEASLAGAQASVVQAEGDLQRARAAYENAVGQPPGTLAAPGLPANLPSNLDGAVNVALKENPNFLAADFSARAQKEAIRVVEGDLLPSLNLIGQYAKTWNATIPGAQSNVLAAGAQVTVPLYQQGAEWARLRQAKDTYGQFLLLADQAKLDAVTGATTAWETYHSTTASLDSIHSQISANEISLEGVQREAEVGSRTVLDVLNAEQTLLNSRVQLVRNEHDQLVASFQLLSAMGKLTGGDLGLGVKLYDPSLHYNEVRGQLIGTNGDTQADIAARKP